MPIRIPNDLPAAGTLQQENIFVMPQDRAMTQDIRPLEIVLLNLMPTKIVTETQLSRLLGNTPLQVHLELMKMSTHKSKNVSAEHLLKNVVRHIRRSALVRRLFGLVLFLILYVGLSEHLENLGNILLLLGLSAVILSHTLPPEKIA